MAPEILESEKYDNSIDVWSLGILLYELYHNKSAFKSKNILHQYKNMISGNFEIRDGVNEDAKKLITKILCSSRENRPRIEDLFEF